MAHLGIPHALRKAPAIVRSSVRQHSLKVELSTPAIGAEISNVSIADVGKDAEIEGILRRFRALPRTGPLLGDDDLYDEDGLPK